ncbi:hypothetical protein SAMN05446037_102215 [Anaerovirgula multivorans]|uniref:VOC domain-containing protein n=1 Tax=Anaerovirgula multivorans TaxID=312168 RepID=A0A239HJL5_9FIRM|nr:VOC family protein [Anaerovirgula multivorans]SNS81023.1 hypothetical protein SAMN05446037_102215 [Anaerovirgula multivorans]
MAYQKKSYVEHMAVRVKDIQWHISFFQEVLGMTIKSVDGSQDNPKQIWTIGGLQLISDPTFEGPEGRAAHLGIMTEDLEAALEEAYERGVIELPQGRNWFVLPDGLCIELMQAKNNAVEKALIIEPRD